MHKGYSCRHIKVRDRESITEQASIRELELHGVSNDLHLAIVIDQQVEIREAAKQGGRVYGL